MRAFFPVGTCKPQKHDACPKGTSTFPIVTSQDDPIYGVRLKICGSSDTSLTLTKGNIVLVLPPAIGCMRTRSFWSKDDINMGK
jgi:hypothetical protein